MSHSTAPEPPRRLVGRDEYVELAQRRLHEVRTGRGTFILVSGEAGIGKTRLSAAVRDAAIDLRFRVAEAALAPHDRDVPAALLLDLARTMARLDGFADVGAGLLAVMDELLGAERPQRRLLIARAVDSFITLAAVPTMLSFDDLQWADELSLEFLSDLARSCRDRPLLMLGAFRSDEIAPRSALREWRSRLVTQRSAEELRLPRLTREQTAAMTSLFLGTDLPAPRDISGAVFDRTDGVPLYIEELLRAVGEERLSDSRAIREVDVPDSLEDATLQRVGRLTPRAQALARAASVVGRRFGPAALASVMDRAVEAVDEPLQELIDHHLVERAGPLGLYDFRHQLLRDALYRSLSERDARRFHARAAQIGAEIEGTSEIHASLHFERAGMQREAYRAALSGARAAARLASHREAADLYRRALANVSDDTPPSEHAEVLAEFGIEAAAIDDNAAAADALAAARHRFSAVGNLLRAAELEAPLTAVRHLLGDGITVAEPSLRGALATLDGMPESRDREIVRARLTTALAQALGKAARVDEAETIARQAIEIAHSLGDEVTELDARAALVMAVPFTGRIEEGLAGAREAIARARELGLDEQAARMYRWAGASSSEVFEVEAAEAWLRDGIAHAERAELWNHVNYMTGHLGLVLWCAGRWTEAMALAEQALADSRGGITTRITALYVLGFVLLGRGRIETAVVRLEECLDLGQRLGELLRVSFPLWGLAEAALLAGRPARAVELCERGRQESARVKDGAFLIPFVVTGTRAHLAAADPAAADRWLEGTSTEVRGRGIPASQTAIEHATGLIRLAGGSLVAAREALEAAVAGWEEHGRTWEREWAKLDLASCLVRGNRRTEAARLLGEVATTAAALESTPLASRAEALRRQLGGSGAAEEAWYPLSVREFEVARQIAAGFTNAQIAAALFVSPKTVSSHVEHILAKLGASRRTEIAAWVATVASTTTQPVR